MDNNFFQNQMKIENNRFSRLTENFTPDDWRQCRNDHYWESDKIQNPLERLKYKNLCVENYLSLKNLLER